MKGLLPAANRTVFRRFAAAGNLWAEGIVAAWAGIGRGVCLRWGAIVPTAQHNPWSVNAPVNVWLPFCFALPLNIDYFHQSKNEFGSVEMSQKWA